MIRDGNISDESTQVLSVAEFIHGIGKSYFDHYPNAHLGEMEIVEIQDSRPTHFESHPLRVAPMPNSPTNLVPAINEVDHPNDPLGSRHRH